MCLYVLNYIIWWARRSRCTGQAALDNWWRQWSNGRTDGGVGAASPSQRASGGEIARILWEEDYTCALCVRFVDYHDHYSTKLPSNVRCVTEWYEGRRLYSILSHQFRADFVWECARWAWLNSGPAGRTCHTLVKRKYRLFQVYRVYLLCYSPLQS